MERQTYGRMILFVALIVFLIALGHPGIASSEVRLIKGQTIYVPAYSHIYHGDREQPFYLAVTLSIRNTSLDHSIILTAVDYYDSDGKLLKSYLTDGPIKLAPMASIRYVVKESDKSGGSGANFIVRWSSDGKVTEPLIESIMISTSTQQGISFTSRGQAINEE